MKPSSRDSNRKGQVALEYLTTYGWALLVIIASIGVLAHFGFLSPSKYIPESCEFGEQLECRDHMLNTNGDLNFRFKNNFNADINITGVDITNEDASPDLDSTVLIPEGKIKRVDVNISKSVINDNSKSDFKVTVTFHRNGSDIDHNISGTVYTKASDPSLTS